MNEELQVLLEDVEPVEDEIEEVEAITRGDEGWTDYVLSLLREGEYYEKGGAIRPKADGLVRLLESFNSEVSWGAPDVHAAERTFASVSIVVFADGIQYVGSAECSDENTKKPFCTYPLASAETRAIGRAAKRALGLVNVLTAEEVGSESESSGGVQKINDSQIAFINRQCKKLNLSVKDIVKSQAEDVKYINEVTHAQGVEINKFLNQLSNNPDNEFQFGEYDQTWTQSFSKK